MLNEEDSKIDPEKLMFGYTPHLLYILGELINRITYSYQNPQTLHVTGNFGAAIREVLITMWQYLDIVQHIDKRATSKKKYCSIGVFSYTFVFYLN